MTKQQTTILWIGLILIGLNVVINIGTIKSVLFSIPSSPAPAIAPVSGGTIGPVAGGTSPPVGGGTIGPAINNIEGNNQPANTPPSVQAV